MEQAIQFTCNGNRLFGILHIPDIQGPPPAVVVIVSGGPQTRYGSHRLYVQLARRLCSRGIAALRFDYEGIGDSEGETVGAEGAEPSIEAALQYVQSVLPGSPRVLWSLCDGATAGALYSSRHEKALAALLLCNPLVNDNPILFKKHYYREKLSDRAFWQRVLSLRLDFRKSLLTAARYLSAAAPRVMRGVLRKKPAAPCPFSPDSFLDSIRDSRCPVHCLLSTDDYVAHEFLDAALGRKGSKILKENGNIRISFIRNADHTFSSPEFKESLFALVLGTLEDMCTPGQKGDTGAGSPERPAAAEGKTL